MLYKEYYGDSNQIRICFGWEQKPGKIPSDKIENHQKYNHKWHQLWNISKNAEVEDELSHHCGLCILEQVVY